MLTSILIPSGARKLFALLLVFTVFLGDLCEFICRVRGKQLTPVASIVGGRETQEERNFSYRGVLWLTTHHLSAMLSDTDHLA